MTPDRIIGDDGELDQGFGEPETAVEVKARLVASEDERNKAEARSRDARVRLMDRWASQEKTEGLNREFAVVGVFPQESVVFCTNPDITPLDDNGVLVSHLALRKDGFYRVDSVLNSSDMAGPVPKEILEYVSSPFVTKKEAAALAGETDALSNLFFLSYFLRNSPNGRLIVDKDEGGLVIENKPARLEGSDHSFSLGSLVDCVAKPISTETAIDMFARIQERVLGVLEARSLENEERAQQHNAHADALGAVSPVPPPEKIKNEDKQKRRWSLRFW